jgi:uncharacterized protein (TIGR03435 family)
LSKSGLKIKASKNEESLGSRIVTTEAQPLVAAGKRQKLAALATYLTNVLKQPVEDHTETAGEYDFVIEFTNPAFVNAESVTTPDIFVALQETLGPSLKPRKIAVPTLFVESAGRR